MLMSFNIFSVRLLHVARSVTMGNTRASMSRTGSRYRLSRFFVSYLPKCTIGESLGTVVKTMSNIYRSLTRYLIAFTLVLVTGALRAYSQEQYALLSHQDEISMFRGYEALIEALNNAEEGDVITLSEGEFKGALINRNLTLRGAGMGFNGGSKTILRKNSDINGQYGDYSLRLLSPAGGRILIEDLECAAGGMEIQYGNKVDIVRCSSIIKFAGDANSVKEMRLINCFLEWGIKNNNVDNPPIIEGSIIDEKVLGVNANHCVIVNETKPSSTVKVQSSTVSNSVIFKATSGEITDNAMLQNCVVVYNFASGDPYYDNYFQKFQEKLSEQSPTNRLLYLEEVVFKEGTSTYELTDENASQWLCDDGTQIGLFGGELPFGNAPGILKIKSLKVADKTDSEGMLRLEVEIQ